MNPLNRLVRITGLCLAGIGILFLVLNIAMGGTLNITPFVFFMLSGAIYILTFLYMQRWKWAAWLFVPSSILLAFGVIFLFNVMTNDWAAWAYAWLLLVAGAGLGAVMVGHFTDWDSRIGLIGAGAVVIGLTLFALFGVIAGGMFIRFMAPILLALGGLALFWLKPTSFLPESVLRRFAPALENPATSAAELPASTPDQKALIEPLSNRELEVLHLIDQGLSNPEIAEKLVVAPSTVKTHINNIYSKLEVQTRVQALNRARELKLLE